MTYLLVAINRYYNLNNCPRALPENVLQALDWGATDCYAF